MEFGLGGKYFRTPSIPFSQLLISFPARLSNNQKGCLIYEYYFQNCYLIDGLLDDLARKLIYSDPMQVLY